MSCSNWLRSAWKNVKLYNVVLLGVGFMLVFAAFQTTAFTAKNVMSSVEVQTNGSFHGDAYLSSSIIYISLAISNWIAPIIVVLIGTKFSLFAGAIPYCLYVASFIYPMEWSFYLTSVLIGMGAAVVWTAQGTLLTRCSDDSTMTRNTAIFLILFQSSIIIGNLIEFVMLQGQEDFEPQTRITLFVVMTIIGVCGAFVFLFFRQLSTLNSDAAESNKSLAKTWTTIFKLLSTLERSWKLFWTRNMLILGFTFAYSGISNSFRAGIYPACVGQNMNFDDPKAMIGIIGFATGISEVVGGVLMTFFGQKIVKKYGRDPLVVVSFVLHIIGYMLTYFNFPDDCPIHETYGASLMSDRIVAIVVALLYGFGDVLLCTAMYSILGHLYSGPLMTPPAFALYVFTQSLASAVAFFYAALVLKYQLLILVIFNTASVVAFVGIEFATSAVPSRKKAKNQPVKQETIEIKPVESSESPVTDF